MVGGVPWGVPRPGPSGPAAPRVLAMGPPWAWHSPWCLLGFFMECPTLHSTLYTLHSTLYTLHYTLYTLHSTLFISMEEDTNIDNKSDILEGEYPEDIVVKEEETSNDNSDQKRSLLAEQISQTVNWRTGKVKREVLLPQEQEQEQEQEHVVKQ